MAKGMHKILKQSADPNERARAFTALIRTEKLLGRLDDRVGGSDC